MDKKTQTAYKLSTRDPPQNKIHAQTKSKKIFTGKRWKKNFMQMNIFKKLG